MRKNEEYEDVVLAQVHAHDLRDEEGQLKVSKVEPGTLHLEPETAESRQDQVDILQE